MTDYPAGTVAIATVQGVKNVKVLRRYSPETGLYDWAFNPVPELGLKYSCSSDKEDLVSNIRVIDTPDVIPEKAPVYDPETMSPKQIERALEEILGETEEESGHDYYEEYTGINGFYHLLANSGGYAVDQVKLELPKKDGGLLVEGLGVFTKVEKTEENFSTYEKSWDDFLVFEFGGRTFRIQGHLDSYDGGVWDGMLHEVTPVYKQIRVWERV